MKKLTQKALEALRVSESNATLSDGESLYGDVRAKRDGTVSVHFRYRYRFAGKTKDFSCGTWPKNSLSEVRSFRDQAKAILQTGLDPSVHKKDLKSKRLIDIEKNKAEIIRLALENKTIRELFEAWLLELRRVNDNKEVKRAFEADFLPYLGDKKVKEITRLDILSILERMIKRGVNRSAVIMRHDLGQMFKWANEDTTWRTLLVNGIPIPKIKVSQILPADYDMQNIRTRILNENEIRELSFILSNARENYNAAELKYSKERPIAIATECAIWIILATLARVGETLKAEWSHIDLEAGKWIIPQENNKTKDSKFLIHLSPLAVKYFEILKTVNGNSKFCFPSTDGNTHVCTKSITKQINDRQTRFRESITGKSKLKNRGSSNLLVLHGGSNGKWTPHDLRRTGATFMQKLKIHPDIIDRCQNHIISGPKVRSHYQLYDFYEEKTHAWETWGSYLTDHILENHY